MALALYISKQFIILSVRTNPKPCNLTTIQYANSSVVNTNSNRINGLAWMDLLKLQTWVIRNIPKLQVSCFSLLANF